MNYRFSSFDTSGKPIEQPILQVQGNDTLEEIKALARLYYVEKKKDHRVKRIELRAGEDVLRPVWSEDFKVN
jgi:hypothetical protein